MVTFYNLRPTRPHEILRVLRNTGLIALQIRAMHVRLNAIHVQEQETRTAQCEVSTTISSLHQIIGHAYQTVRVNTGVILPVISVKLVIVDAMNEMGQEIPHDLVAVPVTTINGQRHSRACVSQNELTATLKILSQMAVSNVTQSETCDSRLAPVVANPAL